MTTIAYNHKDGEIAVDSRVTCGSTIVNDKANKITELNGIVFIGCGLEIDIEKLINSYVQGGSYEQLDASLYAIEKGAVFRCGQDESSGFWRRKCDVNRAEGTGADYALAVMDFGSSAKDAVKYACTRDIYSGERLELLKLIKGLKMLNKISIVACILLTFTHSVWSALIAVGVADLDTSVSSTDRATVSLLLINLAIFALASATALIKDKNN